MSRNAGNDENGRFDEILLTILTNMAKFLFLWIIAHNWRFYDVEGPWKSWRIWRKWRFWRDLVKVVDKMLRANILTRLEGPWDMSRNAGNDENGRFDEILLTILTNMAKFLFLWIIAHNWRFYDVEGPWKSWRIWRKWRFWRDLVKVVDKMLRANILTRLEGPWKSWRIWRIWRIWRKWRFWRNLVKVVDKIFQANILARLEGPWKCWRKWRIWRKWRFWWNLVKAVDKMLRANILISLEGPWKSWRIWWIWRKWRFWRNFVKVVDKLLRVNCYGCLQNVKGYFMNCLDGPE